MSILPESHVCVYHLFIYLLSVHLSIYHLFLNLSKIIYLCLICLSFGYYFSLLPMKTVPHKALENTDLIYLLDFRIQKSKLKYLRFLFYIFSQYFIEVSILLCFSYCKIVYILICRCSSCIYHELFY